MRVPHVLRLRSFRQPTFDHASVCRNRLCLDGIWSRSWLVGPQFERARWLRVDSHRPRLRRTHLRFRATANDGKVACTLPARPGHKRSITNVSFAVARRQRILRASSLIPTAQPYLRSCRSPSTTPTPRTRRARAAVRSSAPARIQTQFRSGIALSCASRKPSDGAAMSGACMPLP
jgi:hypothetical protein